jgi:pimeloyl-ACP methyl ester carboxylesterase
MKVHQKVQQSSDLSLYQPVVSWIVLKELSKSGLLHIRFSPRLCKYWLAHINQTIMPSVLTRVGDVSYSIQGTGPPIILLHATLHTRHDFDTIIL